MKSVLSIKTGRRIETIDITQLVQKAIPPGVDGFCIVYTPHTTTAVGINEGADPDVAGDINRNLAALFPEDGDYRHREGNSDAHLKSILMGPSETVLLEGGNLLLGRWQSIYFCEFDGPRNRNLYVTVVQGA